MNIHIKVGCKVGAEIILLKMELRENEGMRDIPKHAYGVIKNGED